jgi:hypothetical protein
VRAGYVSENGSGKGCGCHREDDPAQRRACVSVEVTSIVWVNGIDGASGRQRLLCVVEGKENDGWVADHDVVNESAIEVPRDVSPLGRGGRGGREVEGIEEAETRACRGHGCLCMCRDLEVRMVVVVACVSDLGRYHVSLRPCPYPPTSPALVASSTYPPLSS